ncbi:MAG: abortive infection protein, partial [Solirubrobacteraceae bacterium]
DQQRASLREFLERAAETARAAFAVEITYASLPFEDVDWSLFDVVGLDHYREARIKDRYVQMLEPLLGLGKPTLVTEVGMRGYQGAESSGVLGFGVADTRSLFLHSLPVVGRFMRPHLQAGEFVRDEELQAREITETLEIIEQAGVDGAFVYTFVEQLSPYSEEPRYDLDMSALSLVKTYADRMGTTYPDMTWEPKASFRAVAEFYARHSC